MNILVTGGAGYIGSHTVQKLLVVNHKVTVFDNLTTGFREAVPAQANLVVGDIRDTATLSRAIKDHRIEAVVHLAAKLIILDSIQNPLFYYENNVQGTLSLLKACTENGVQNIVFSSTGSVYGDAGGFGLISENAPTGPLSPYSFSKLMGEQMLRDSEKTHGIKSVSLRYFNAAGAALNGKNGQRTKNATHIVKVASQAACGKRDFVEIFGTNYPTPDGTGVRDYIHVEDLADLHLLALSYLAQGGPTEIFNCGYGVGFSVKQIIDCIRKVSGQEFNVFEKERRPGDAAHLVADATKVKKAFSWQPQHNDLDVICRTAYEWEVKTSL